MTDNLCGGSTPLKALAEQGARDRSLQQDRAHHASGGPLTFRSSEPEASRHAGSSYNSYLGGIDRSLPAPYITEQAGVPLGAHFNPFQGGRQQASRPAAAESVPYIGGPPPMATWAQDFNKLNHQVDSPSRTSGLAQTVHLPPTSVQPSHMRQHYGHPYSSSLSNQPMMAPQVPSFNAGMWPSTMFGSQQTHVREGGGDFDFDTAMQQWMTSNGDRGAEEQVDAVMEELARELEDMQQADIAKQVSTQEHLSTDPVTQEDIPTATMSERGALAATVDEHAVDSMPTVKSEVSEAARQLLQTVQHEQGDKWKKSQFLLLMRDFRDGQKDIVDNEIRQAST